MMAAGSALLGLSNPGSDIDEIVRQHQCGINVTPGDVDAAVSAILEMRASSTLLQNYRKHARTASEQHYSASVCIPQILRIIERHL
jgi:glycosyltransferase involved in cell wall biosynthesis